ncbi:MAG: type I restriction enzyme HsdR N-terminal domain-containing protein [Chloroflexi bacterium]|nr:type I restriction enzyme HsdR N-terminal domain-containing protein [Chloroflexota bacterium]
MDFIDRMLQISTRTPRQLAYIKTEEATKNAFVMPFIQALGYNVFDPTEVVPEYTADIGSKKSEKVDYAIVRDGKPIMLIEAKCATSDLSRDHASQLFRYFSATDARFGILTNGIQYQFHTDLEKPNQMDEKPFLIVDMLNFDARQVAALKEFTKSIFNMDQILSTANQLKYKREISLLIEAEFHEPSTEIVRHFTRQVYSGRLRASVLDEFREIFKDSFREFINAKITNRMTSPIGSEGLSQNGAAAHNEDDRAAKRAPSGSETAQDEMDGFYVVKAILRDIIDPSRIIMRNVRPYCNILLDNDNRQPICRLHFKPAKMYLSLFHGEHKGRVEIDSILDIYKYSEQLKQAVLTYLAAE